MTEIQNKRETTKKLILNLFSALLGLVLILLLIKISGVTFDTIINGIFSIKYYYVIIVVLLTVGVVLFTSWKWEIIVKDLTDINKAIYGYFFFFCAMGMASNTIIPHIGNYGIKTTSLKLNHEVPLGTGSLTVLIEQLFDLLILILFLIPSLLFFAKIFSLESSIALLVILSLFFGFLLILNHNRMIEIIVRGFKLLIEVASRLPLFNNFLKSDLELSNKDISISKDTSIKLFCYSYLRQLLLILRVFIITYSLNMNVSFMELILATPIVQGLTLIVAIPRAIGILEASWFGVLTILGISKPEIGVFIIASRVLTEASLFFITFIGYIGYAVSKLLYKPTFVQNK